MRGKRTSLRLGGKPSGKARLLERSPFEILLIASTRNVPLATLLASRFRFVTLEALCLARNASYGLSVAHVYLSVFFPTSPSFFPSPPLSPAGLRHPRLIEAHPDRRNQGSHTITTLGLFRSCRCGYRSGGRRLLLDGRGLGSAIARSGV